MRYGPTDDQDAPRVDLWPVCRVPSSSQLAHRCGYADLEIGRWLAAERVPVDWRALRSGCRARRGVLNQRVPGRSWPWRSACEQFSEIMGVRYKELAIEGVQFHPESILTEHGHAMLKNFLEQAA